MIRFKAGLVTTPQPIRAATSGGGVYLDGQHTGREAGWSCLRELVPE